MHHRRKKYGKKKKKFLRTLRACGGIKEKSKRENTKRGAEKNMTTGPDRSRRDRPSVHLAIVPIPSGRVRSNSAHAQPRVPRAPDSAPPPVPSARAPQGEISFSVSVSSPLLLTPPRLDGFRRYKSAPAALRCRRSHSTQRAPAAASPPRARQSVSGSVLESRSDVDLVVLHSLDSWRGSARR